MLKQNDPAGNKRSIGNDAMLSLAKDLVALLADSSELCTPGHRMGRGYQLLVAGLTEITSPDRRQASRLESAGIASPELR